MNAQIIHCPNCGKRLTSGALMGLCPACLLNTGFDSIEGRMSTARTFVPPEPHIVERHFPSLQVIELIGQGGMGAVYKARQTKLDRFVALKILRASGKTDPEFAQRFEREARALAKFQHPNIVTLYEYGQADGQYYLLMEYVDGVNLRQLLDSRHISPKEALAIVPQICDALQYAHDRGVVHRDIKPENILMDQRGTVKIADFGVAKMIGGEAENEAHKLVGTPRYMAPEQVLHPLKVDNRADIYALGAVFYQMLTGDLPAGKFEPPSRKMFIDVRLDAVVLQALEKHPEKRYQQVSALKTRIESLVNEMLSEPKPRRRSRIPVGVILAGVAIVACLSAGLLAFRNFTKDLEIPAPIMGSDEKNLTVDLSGEGLEASEEAGGREKSNTSAATSTDSGTSLPGSAETEEKKSSDEEALAKSLSELKGAAALGKIEVGELLAGVIVSAISAPEGSRMTAVESVFVVRASPSSIMMRFASWYPVSQQTKVMRHVGERCPTFDTVISLPYGETSFWTDRLTKMTEQLPNSASTLNLSAEEIESYRKGPGDGTVFPAHVRDFWIKVMEGRQKAFSEKKAARIAPYQKPIDTIDPLKEFAAIKKTPLIVDSTKGRSYYWEFIESAERRGQFRPGVFALGARKCWNRQSVILTEDFQYYSSADNYASLSEQRISQVLLDGKPASLVWQRDLTLKSVPEYPFSQSEIAWYQKLPEAEKARFLRHYADRQANLTGEEEKKLEVPAELKSRIELFRKAMEKSVR